MSSVHRLLQNRLEGVQNSQQAFQDQLQCLKGELENNYSHLNQALNIELLFKKVNFLLEIIPVTLQTIKTNLDIQTDTSEKAQQTDLPLDSTTSQIIIVETEKQSCSPKKLQFDSINLRNDEGKIQHVTKHQPLLADQDVEINMNHSNQKSPPLSPLPRWKGPFPTCSPYRPKPDLNQVKPAVSRTGSGLRAYPSDAVQVRQNMLDTPLLTGLPSSLSSLSTTGQYGSVNSFSSLDTNSQLFETISSPTTPITSCRSRLHTSYSNNEKGEELKTKIHIHQQPNVAHLAAHLQLSMLTEQLTQEMQAKKEKEVATIRKQKVKFRRCSLPLPPSPNKPNIYMNSQNVIPFLISHASNQTSSLQSCDNEVKQHVLAHTSPLLHAKSHPHFTQINPPTNSSPQQPNNMPSPKLQLNPSSTLLEHKHQQPNKTGHFDARDSQRRLKRSRSLVVLRSSQVQLMNHLIPLNLSLCLPQTNPHELLGLPETRCLSCFAADTVESH